MISGSIDLEDDLLMHAVADIARSEKMLRNQSENA